jgi:SAM-dependent methyltransferase
VQPRPLRPEHFEREDESSDEVFYSQPRLVVHIDEGAIAALTQYLREVLPPNGDVLDLMSSWRSHLPEDVPLGRVVGLGMNAVELAENPQLTERVVHDLNADPRLPFGDAEFDAVLLTVSVQYLVRPIEVFGEVGRVLRPGGRFTVSFSNRMFPTKAVRIWRDGSDIQHIYLVARYLREAGCFTDVAYQDRSPGAWRDPLYLVYGKKAAD